MGNICANASLEPEQCTSTVDTFKNAVQWQTALGGCAVSLILGHYKQHRSESLMVICELKNIQHCDPVRDYVSDPDKTIDMICSMRKNFHKASVNKHCPYRKLFICVMPQYRSEEQQEYVQQLKNVVREGSEGVKELAVEMLNTIEGIHTLPNQLVLRTLLGEVKQRNGLRLQLITTDKKMMNMYRFELIKFEGCELKGCE